MTKAGGKDHKQAVTWDVNMAVWRAVESVEEMVVMLDDYCLGCDVG